MENLSRSAFYEQLDQSAQTALIISKKKDRQERFCSETESKNPRASRVRECLSNNNAFGVIRLILLRGRLLLCYTVRLARTRSFVFIVRCHPCRRAQQCRHAGMKATISPRF